MNDGPKKHEGEHRVINLMDALRKSLAENDNGELIEITDAELDRMHEKGEAIFDFLMTMLEDEPDAGVGVMFSVFIQTIHLISEAGWTVDELKQEIETHGGKR